MISEQNMGYGVRHTFEEWNEFALLFSRERVMGVSGDFGGRYILIGCLYHNAYVMHKNQELTLIRACSTVLLSARHLSIDC